MGVYLAKKHKSEVPKITSSNYNDIVPSIVPPSSHCPMQLLCHPAAHCAAGIAHRHSDSAESIIGTVSYSQRAALKNMMLSASAESIILSAPPAKSIKWSHLEIHCVFLSPDFSTVLVVTSLCAAFF